MRNFRFSRALPILMVATLLSCKEKHELPSGKAISELNLKRGQLISCGPADKQFGLVAFDITGEGSLKDQFNLGMKLLHSFEYEEAEKTFAHIIDEYPGCAMAYWGVAMSNFHPLWTPPSVPELEKGSRALAIAAAITPKSKRESEYIDALQSFYGNWQKDSHRSRCLAFEKSMEKLHADYPRDQEAAILYALALDAAADPTDKTYAKQKKAGDILNALYPGQPHHPGIVHYIIHTYDYPGLAEKALPAARQYAAVAPSSAHALHMPSHIFTRLGLWDECIQSNLASVSSAQCYAQTAGIKGHWDEELHGLDYLVYAYLQRGENDKAKKQLDYLGTIREVYPTNFKVAYAFAAIPSRILLENSRWQEAAQLTGSSYISWQKYPWENAIIHFTRLIGSVYSGGVEGARNELAILKQLRDTLLNQKDGYKAQQVQIQIKAGEALIKAREGKKQEALQLMNLAADMEDSTEKHPVTPCEVVPARELLGNLLRDVNENDLALQAYEADLQKHPNRFNALYGAAVAAGKKGDMKKAGSYYHQLLAIASPGSDRRELNLARKFVESQP